jgi:hypothetical protein
MWRANTVLTTRTDSARANRPGAVTLAAPQRDHTRAAAFDERFMLRTTQTCSPNERWWSENEVSGVARWVIIKKPEELVIIT